MGLKSLFNVVLTDKPGPPASVKISHVFADRVKLRWEPPRSDGGAEITNYIVDKRETSRANWAQVTSNINGQITNCSVEKLIEGHEYEFRISAENKYGVGDPIVTASVIAKNPFGKYLRINMLSLRITTQIYKLSIHVHNVIPKTRCSWTL